MAQDNVISITFPESSKAYEAFTVLKNLSASDQLDLSGGVIVVRDANGNVSFPEGQDNVDGLGFAGGSLIGMFVGILGGPLGMLLGWGTGALIGGAVDVSRAGAADEVIAEFSRAIPPNTTAIVAEVNEVNPVILDDAIAKIGSGVITRRPTHEVLAELEAAQEAAEAAAREARRVVKEKKKEERKEKHEERVANLKKKLHID